MNRLLYSLAFYLAQPLVVLRLGWRARKQPEYLRHLGERYGFYRQPKTPGAIWLHAVSLGETRAAEPLIKALLDRYPERRVVLTHMTPTGRAAGTALIEKYGPRLSQAYLPYDLPGACRRFFSHFSPSCGLLMETEIWPNLIAAAAGRDIPLALINARLSARSQRGYQRLAGLIRPALGALRLVAAQTAADAERLQSLGATNVHITGNLKFDVRPSAEKRALGERWRDALGDRPVWLAASTREGEEELILDAFARLALPRKLLLLVPRHPQRFADVARIVGDRGVAFARRSLEALPDEATGVWLGDSLGEMPAYYSVADLALIGGTLLPFGGQNLIEAAACGCPVLVGPHTFNFAQATDDAVSCGAACRVSDADAAAEVAAQLLTDSDRLRAMRTAAMQFSRAHGGATERTVTLIEKLLADATR